MPDTKPDIENYYEGYGRNAFDLDLKALSEYLSQVEIPPDTLQSLREKDHIKFLVLGSAAPNNLDGMAMFDRVLRPGKGEQDTVFIIDYNAYPLYKHQERAKFLEEWEASSKKYNKSSEPNPLPYPKFELIQADMRQLP